VCDDVPQLVSRFDGLLLSGGDFDVPPDFYGQEITHERVATRPRRSHFERNLALEALSIKLPLLGICGGMQILNVACGGTLIQHIPDTPEAPILHEQPNPRNEVGHRIDIVPQTPLWDLNKGQKEAMVNSAHHQAVDTLGCDLKAMAWAPDGILEAFYHPSHDFCWGVEWHPEFLITDLDHRVCDAFIAASKKFQARHAVSHNETL